MLASVKIGTWHERESRQLIQHTGYAADWIEHRSKPGEYQAFLLVDTLGFTIHMPKFLSVTLTTEVVDGEYYSGFGCVNFSSRKAQTGPSTYTLQPYSYGIPAAVAAGDLTLDPEYEWLNQESRLVHEHIRSTGWKA